MTRICIPEPPGVVMERKTIRIEEIGSFYLNKVYVKAGVLYELEPVNDTLHFGSFQFATEKDAINYAKNMSKRYKKILKNLNL